MYGTFGRYCDGFLNFGRMNYGGITTMIIGLVLIAAVVYFIVKGRRGVSTESPLDLLQRRFVNGEISEDEYRMKKEILGKK